MFQSFYFTVLIGYKQSSTTLDNDSIISMHSFTIKIELENPKIKQIA